MNSLLRGGYKLYPPLYDLELIFSMLGEASTTEIIKTKNPKGFVENKKVAKQGGDIAGNARLALEEKTGKNSYRKKTFFLPLKRN